MKFVLLVLAGLLLSGCTVGRYVTNVSSSGANKLAIEKCTTKKWADYFWNTECSESTITIQ